MKALQMAMEQDIKRTRDLKVCIICNHIRVETEDKNKQICTCEEPVLYSQKVANSMSIYELREAHKAIKEREKKVE